MLNLGGGWGFGKLSATEGACLAALLTVFFSVTGAFGAHLVRGRLETAKKRECQRGLWVTPDDVYPPYCSAGLRVGVRGRSAP